MHRLLNWRHTKCIPADLRNRLLSKEEVDTRLQGSGTKPDYLVVSASDRADCVACFTVLLGTDERHTVCCGVEELCTVIRQALGVNGRDRGRENNMPNNIIYDGWRGAVARHADRRHV